MSVDEHIALWNQRLKLSLKCLREQGAEVEAAFIAGEPRPDLLSEAEAQLRRPLPAVLSAIVSRQVALRGSWRLGEDLVRRLPAKTKGVEWGGIDLSVREMVAAEQSRRAWQEECFPNPNDAYDRVWHDKFAFLTVRNGDCIALVEDGDNSPVYYLSHDDGEGHGVLLAPSVFSFFDQLSQLAFAGPEDWLLLPFVESTLGLNAQSQTARDWREALHLKELAFE